MTLAPERTTASSSTPLPVVSVTAVLLPPPDTSGAQAPSRLTRALGLTLDGLAEQTRRPDRVVVVLPGPAGGSVAADGISVEDLEAVAREHRLARDTPVVTVPLVQRGRSAPAAAVGAALSAIDADPLPDAGEEHLWVLGHDSDPDPAALQLLLRTLRGSDSAGVVGPKLVQWHDTSRLQSMGIQATRTGRLLPTPPPGEPDQGQYDDRTDVLGVPLTGMLVSRAVLDDLGGMDPTLEPLGAALDLSWRAHLAGHRVVVVPRAVVATADPLLTTPDARRRATARGRRQARRVALTRCTVPFAPFLAVWVLVSSVVAAVALLLAKRPGRAWSELADAGAIVNPARTLAARLRFRRRKGGVQRRHLRGLFVGSAASVRASLDLVQDVVLPGSGDAVAAPLQAPTVPESGPVDDSAEDLNAMAPSLLARTARNPGVAATVLTAVAAGVGVRTWGNPVDVVRSGLTGGELTTPHASSADLWRSWLDGWHGAGLGTDAVAAPHLPLLAGLAWLVEHVPFLDAPASPVATATALLLLLALPVGTAAAYVAGRVVTHQRWPRAVAALVWAGAATSTTAVAGGRVGAAAAVVLLPLTVAAVARSAQRQGTATAAFAGGLLGAVASAFLPLLLPVLVLVALLQLLLGRGAVRWRGLPLLLVPAALLGPWWGAVLADPRLLLTGPGLTQWGTVDAVPWQIALLHPGGPGSYPVLLTAPVVLAAVIGLVRPGAAVARWALALLAVVGLAGGLLAPAVVLGVAPEGTPQGGTTVTPWSGGPLLLLALAVTALALLAVSDLPLRRREAGWSGPVRVLGATGVGVAVLASLALPAWTGLGSSLSPWSDPRPAVAVDQSEGPLAGRMLVLTPSDGRVQVTLIGREPGDVARSLPQDATVAGVLAAPVSSLLAPSAGATDSTPFRDLALLGVGYVGLAAGADDPLVATLDASAGLTRMGSRDGVLHWRVRSDVTGVSGPPRVRVVTGQTDTEAGTPTALDVDGAHSATTQEVPATQDARLVVGEAAGWSEVARVHADGRLLLPEADTDRPSYALPDGTTEVSIDVPPVHRVWTTVQCVLAVAAIFLALPLGRRRRREDA